MVSTATRLVGSSLSIASRIASLIWSAILSGCPSVTDSEVNRRRDMTLPGTHAPRGMRGEPLLSLTSERIHRCALHPGGIVALAGGERHDHGSGRASGQARRAATRSQTTWASAS